MKNFNKKVIEEFGEEWEKFDYNEINKDRLKENFDEYFSIFPFELINENSIGFDMGCGSGRWAQFIAPKIKKLNCIEPSTAIEVAKKNLREFKNICFLNERTENCSLKESSQDFGYCLGVLHHIPDTLLALGDCAKLLKSKSPFLLYLYYNFENRPLWFKLLWKLSDYIRRLICILPAGPKKNVCTLIAYTIYLPLTKISSLLEIIGINVENFPLSSYRKKPFYQCVNDALDRFGTRIEQRFSKEQIKDMLKKTGFENIKFSSQSPYWCCLAFKK